MLLLHTADGHTVFLDDFDDGTDRAPLLNWNHYAPLNNAPFNAEASWTFPEEDGGKAYRIFGGAPQNNSGGPVRIGSFPAAPASRDFFIGVDLVKWDDKLVNNVGFMIARAALSPSGRASGYLVGYISDAEGFSDHAGQSAFMLVAFQSDINVSAPDRYTGGTAFLSRLNPMRKYRMVFSGAGPNLRAALYDRTDLLEPVVKIAAVHSMTTNGNYGIGALNLDEDKPADFTFDNYLAAANPAMPVGFPGTPQVVDLVPAPQTLFYPISQSNPITFALRTFNTNQVATNSVKLFLNHADVSGQLVLADLSTATEPKSHWGVRYTGKLSANTIYNGQIIVLDTAGKGTTNKWIFDTFPTNGTLTIEAEDYNFTNGLFMDNPPVSGFMADGESQVNGHGVGYLDLAGTRGVDYFDHNGRLDTDAKPNANLNQYRLYDGVETLQDVRSVRDTPRQKHLQTGVPDFEVSNTRAGEWLNYTRTFPSNIWDVYLRASAQARQDVRLDEITSGSKTTNQMKAPLGTFLVPNTGSSTRYRYVPLTDAVGNPRPVDLAGVLTLRLTELAANNDLQLNYLLFVPRSKAAVLSRPLIAVALPAPDAVKVDPQPTVQIAILDRGSNIIPASVKLRFDNSDVTRAAVITRTTTESPDLTIRYEPPEFLQPKSKHTISLSFDDDARPAHVQSNQWSFTVADILVIPPGFALKTQPDTAFTIQVHKAANLAPPNDFPNSSLRGERQLANQIIEAKTGKPYVNEVANRPGNVGLYTETNAINYEQNGLATGFFPGDKRYPGITTTDPDHFAMAATIKLPLAAGVYRMGVNSDDGFKVSTGASASSATNLVLGNSDQSQVPGRRNDGQFDFIVATNGVYAFRLLQYEGSGGAHVEWYWVNRTTGQRELIRPVREERRP
ncbi:MAG: hypothetical protein HY298_02810 [Verrucomicrobia bacterium]|nr:hypothetical protein [Verrucomicrobiota bacterium]